MICGVGFVSMASIITGTPWQSSGTKDGDHYRRGKGFLVFCDGKQMLTPFAWAT